MAAPARRAPPQIATNKVVGINTNSKASTNSKALRARKAPTTPRLVASSRQKNRRGRDWSIGVTRIASVVNRAANNTSGRLKPSRPRSRVSPSFGSQAWWRSLGGYRQQSSPSSNCNSGATTAASRNRSGRRWGSSGSSSAMARAMPGIINSKGVVIGVAQESNG